MTKGCQQHLLLACLNVYRIFILRPKVHMHNQVWSSHRSRLLLSLAYVLSNPIGYHPAHARTCCNQSRQQRLIHSSLIFFNTLPPPTLSMMMHVNKEKPRTLCKLSTTIVLFPRLSHVNTVPQQVAFFSLHGPCPIHI